MLRIRGSRVGLAGGPFMQIRICGGTLFVQSGDRTFRIKPFSPDPLCIHASRVCCSFIHIRGHAFDVCGGL